MNPEKIFKTLVLKGEKVGYIVICIPILKEIDLKKAARAVGDKKIEMIPMKDLLNVTGYIRGGCSPVGMKKKFKTYFDDTIETLDEVAVSAGHRGMQMILNPKELVAYVDGMLVDVCKDA